MNIFLLSLLSNDVFAQSASGDAVESVDVAAEPSATSQPAAPSPESDVEPAEDPVSEEVEFSDSPDSLAAPEAETSPTLDVDSTGDAAPVLDSVSDVDLLGTSILSMGMDPLSASSGMSMRRPVYVGAFADTSFTLQDELAASGFSLGQVVLHSRAQLGGGFSVFGEVTLNSVPTWEARVERLIFEWEASDALKISVGRMHLPVTWWNSTFHHGLWLQTTASRPRAVTFGEAFIPNHYKGMTVSGLLPVLQPLGVRYLLGVSNGSDDDPQADGVDIPFSGAVFGTLAFEPPSAPFLRLGAATHLEVEQALAGEEQGARSLQSGLHVAYTKERPEVVGEMVLVRHQDKIAPDAVDTSDTAETQSSRTVMPMDGAHVHSSMNTGTNGDVHISAGAYLQLAWRLRVGGDRFKPYLRYEQMTIHPDDLTLVNQSGAHFLLTGLRTDLTDSVALKVEGAAEMVDAIENWSVQTQLSAAW